MSEQILVLKQGEKYLPKDMSSVVWVERTHAIETHDQIRIGVATILFTQDKEGEILLVSQERGKNKQEYPSHVTFACSGHVSEEDVDEFGEIDYLRALKRECQEELGFVPDGLLNQTFSYFPTLRDNKLVYTSICYVPREELDIKLRIIDPTEVSRYIFTPYDDLFDGDELHEIENLPYTPEYAYALKIIQGVY